MELSDFREPMVDRSAIVFEVLFQRTAAEALRALLQSCWWKTSGPRADGTPLSFPHISFDFGSVRSIGRDASRAECAGSALSG